MSGLSKSLAQRIADMAKEKRERDYRKRKSNALVNTSKKRRKPKPKKTVLRVTKAPKTYEEAKALYNTIWYKDWREQVFKRDSFTCQMCGAKNVPLEGHHIKPKYLYPELTLVVDNGITLCAHCHQDRVNKHEEQFIYIFERIVQLNKR